MRHPGILLVVLPLLLAGCAGISSSKSAAPEPGTPLSTPAQWLGGLPLPPGSSIRADQSLIIGAGDNWVGRAVLDIGRDSEAGYRFFLDQLPAQGWTLVTTVRGRQSLLVFTRQERTLTVEMNDPLLGSSGAILTMSPRNAAVIAPRKP